MIDGNKHLIKYSWGHAFTAVIWCDNCKRGFKVNEIIYKRFLRQGKMILYAYYCLKCARRLKLKDAP